MKAFFLILLAAGILFAQAPIAPAKSVAIKPTTDVKPKVLTNWSKIKDLFL